MSAIESPTFRDRFCVQTVSYTSVDSLSISFFKCAKLILRYLCLCILRTNRRQPYGSLYLTLSAVNTRSGIFTCGNRIMLGTQTNPARDNPKPDSLLMETICLCDSGPADSLRCIRNPDSGVAACPTAAPPLGHRCRLLPGLIPIH